MIDQNTVIDREFEVRSRSPRFSFDRTNASEASDSTSTSTASLLSIEHITLVFNTLLALSLVVFFFALIRPFLFLPADLLMWEEGDFVGNIIKLNIGAPLYTDPTDSNSLIYNPGAFLLTYVIALVTGQTHSVIGLRLIQIGFIVVTTVIATVCSRKLTRLVFPGEPFSYAPTWTLFSFFALFLAATSAHTNKFVYTLHVDAAALLVVAFSTWMMIRYAERSTLTNLLLMAACPALGFLTKQFLVSLVPVMAVFLIVLKPREVSRLVSFLVASGSAIALAYAVCYAVWGDNFLFWTFEVMGGVRKAVVLSPDAYSISLSRAFDHLSRVWVEILVGVVGVWWMIRSGTGRLGWALATSWLVLIASEWFSSGAGWETLYHFGPGVLVGAVFMLASLPSMWRYASRTAGNTSPLLTQRIAAAALVTAVIAGMFMAWRVVPTGDRTEPRYVRALGSANDLNRYVGEIEGEFEGQDPRNVLIGVGNWVYLQHDVLQKDRAVALGDQPLAGRYENFDVTVARIRNKTYSKVLVHDFHSPFFLYDWADWPRPSGFREALTENYTEVKTIAPAQGTLLSVNPQVFSGPVSVFVPKS